MSPSPKPLKNAIFTAIAQIERGLRGRNSIATANLQQVRNFLFLQLESPLGSVVHATPVFEALRRAAPDAHIAVAASAMAHEVLSLNRYITRCIPIPSPFEYLRDARRALKELLGSMPPGPCAILTTIGNQRTRIALLALTTGKGLRAGYTLAPEIYDLPLRFDPERGQIESNLDILRHFGHPVSFGEPCVFFSQEESDYASGLLAEIPFPETAPRIAFVTRNSGGQRNQWSQDRFRQLIAPLTQTRGAIPIFVGTVADASSIDLLRASLPQPGISAAGKTSVRQLAALLAKCDLAISLDTGTFHVARAVSLPGVVIAPAWQSAREWLPLENPRYRVLQGPRLYQPPPDYWIEEISVDQVLQAALGLLDQFPSSAAMRAERIQNSLSLSSALRQ